MKKRVEPSEKQREEYDGIMELRGQLGATEIGEVL